MDILTKQRINVGEISKEFVSRMSLTLEVSCTRNLLNRIETEW